MTWTTNCVKMWWLCCSVIQIEKWAMSIVVAHANNPQYFQYISTLITEVEVHNLSNTWPSGKDIIFRFQNLDWWLANSKFSLTSIIVDSCAWPWRLSPLPLFFWVPHGLFFINSELFNSCWSTSWYMLPRRLIWYGFHLWWFFYGEVVLFASVGMYNNLVLFVRTSCCW